MSKSTGKLKYDLALSTTSVYDASSIYINKSAELSINGNAKLQYQTIGPTYSENNFIQNIPLPAGVTKDGKQYVYIRNLGPSNAAALHIAYNNPGSAVVPLENTSEQTPAIGVPALADEYQVMSLNVGEFAFFPLFTNNKAGLQLRSGYIVGSTHWVGAELNDIEYMVCDTNYNIGPGFLIQD